MFFGFLGGYWGARSDVTILLNRHFGWGTPSSSSTALRIGILNQSRIAEEAIIYQRLQKCIDEARQKSQNMIEKMEEPIRQDYKKLYILESKTPTQSEEMIQLKKSIEIKTSQLEQTLQKKKISLDDQFQRQEEKIRCQMKKAIEAVVRKYKLDIIFNTTLSDQVEIVIWSHNRLNITDEVISLLNTQLE